MRIVGTYSLTNTYGDMNVGKSEKQTRNTGSVSASSENSSRIVVFVGSAPVKYFSDDARREGNKGEDIGEESMFTSSILTQECKHFCSSRKCYSSPWEVKPIRTDFSVNCKIDLDGTVSKEQLSKHFLLNWSRQIAPSSTKWTRDVHETGGNIPGILKLSIPYVFFNSTKNVRALESILDNNIETFMKVRSKIHVLSSYK